MTALQNMRNAESAFGPLRTSNQGHIFFLGCASSTINFGGGVAQISKSRGINMNIVDQFKAAHKANKVRRVYERGRRVWRVDSEGRAINNVVKLGLITLSQCPNTTMIPTNSRGAYVFNVDGRVGQKNNG